VSGQARPATSCHCSGRWTSCCGPRWASTSRMSRHPGPGGARRAAR